jgi:hypothetical protein
MVLGSVIIIAHLSAIGVAVLAAPSGPWPSMEGPSMPTQPPKFAQMLNNLASPLYLKWIKMTHNYHFVSNRTDLPAVYFEARLKDENGHLLTALQFPDNNANAIVRHRQSLLAQGLGDDIPVPPPAGEALPAPNQNVIRERIWEPGADRMLQLRPVAQHLIPRDRPVYKPNDWAMLLARSYARYLCRLHGAASVELLRHWREPLPPQVLYSDPPPGAFGEYIANFGELPRD